MASNRHERRKQKKKQKRKASSSELAHMDQDDLARLENAVLRQQNGDHAFAEDTYRQLLKKYPRNADCLNLLGVVERTKGNPEEAVKLLRKALSISHQPAYLKNLANSLRDLNQEEEVVEIFTEYLSHVDGDATECNFMGSSLHRLGRYDEAISYLEKALEKDCDYAPAYNNLGITYLDMGEVGKARPYLEKAIELEPSQDSFLSNLGLLFSTIGDKKTAIDYFDRALEINPDNLGAQQNRSYIAPEEDLESSLENLLQYLPNSPNRFSTLIAIAHVSENLNRHEDALHYIQQAMTIEPHSAVVHFLFAKNLHALNKFDEAIPYIQASIELDPLSADTYQLYGMISHSLFDYVFAVACYARAMELRPGDANAMISLGVVLANMGEYEKSDEQFCRALKINPNNAEAHYNRSYTLFFQGRLREAWKGYSYRYQVKSFLAASPLRNFSSPQWDGAPLEGKTILVYAEQGLGDQIFFSTMLPEVIAQGGKVIFEADSRMKPLYERTYPGIHVVNWGFSDEDAKDLGVDCHISIADIARFSRNSFSEFPNDPPTLVIDPDKAKKWQGRLSSISDRPKIGITWRSGMAGVKRAFNYANIADLAPILTIEGVDFVNLQYSYDQEELDEARERYGIELHTWDDIDLKDDLDDVAALASSLDLVISAGTAVSQISGIVGQTVYLFTLKSFNWNMFGRDDIPWYKDVHAFGKHSPQDDWSDTLNELRMVTEKYLDLT